MMPQSKRIFENMPEAREITLSKDEVADLMKWSLEGAAELERLEKLNSAVIELIDELDSCPENIPSDLWNKLCSLILPRKENK